MTKKKRVLSGMRPTGPLHLGNLHGALANWVTMQEQYDCFFFIADWHALTSDYEDTEMISPYIQDRTGSLRGLCLCHERSCIMK